MSLFSHVFSFEFFLRRNTQKRTLAQFVRLVLAMPFFVRDFDSQKHLIRQPAVGCEENRDEDTEFVFARFVACQIHACERSQRAKQCSHGQEPLLWHSPLVFFRSSLV